MTARKAALVLAAAALAGLVWLGVRRAGPAPSDEERIRAAFAAAATAAGEKRPGDVMQLVSERFQGAGMDRREVHQLVVAQTLRATWAAVSLGEVKVAVAGDRARANLDVLLAGATGRGKGLAELLPDEARVYRFRCALAREDGAWKVVSAEWTPVSLGEAVRGPGEPDAPE